MIGGCRVWSFIAFTLLIMCISGLIPHFTYNSIIEELNHGVDHFLPGECPGAPDSGFIVPLVQNRHNDTNDHDIQNHLDLFSSHFEKIEHLAMQADTNFFLGHRPLFGLGCDNGTIVTLDWTLQQSLGPSSLDQISATFHGHMQ